MLLHGEQYLEWKRPLPTSGSLVNEFKVVDILNKGKGVVFIIGVTIKDEAGNEICYNEYSNFIRGVKGVGNKTSADRGAATAENKAPSRAPDAIVKEKTSETQAALYRLSGDRNPLHIDPEMSKMGGFDVPILHGLCTFGIAGKHVFKTFANCDPKMMKSIKVRFSRHVFPGETLQTEMWREDGGKRILFQVRVLERNVLAITNAAVELNAASTLPPAISSNAGQSSDGALADVPGFKSSAMFKQIAASIEARSTEDRVAQVKKMKAIFQFDITNGAKTQSWTIDLKNGGGSVIVGKTQQKPDVTIIVSDADFVDLAAGKLNAQKAFMGGQIKLRGQMMLATKLDGLLKDATKSSKL